MRDTGNRESETHRDERESWIWKRRRGVEARDGHLSVRKEELVGERGCGQSNEQDKRCL